MIRLFAGLLALCLLTACAEPVWAPEAEVKAFSYRDDGPPRLTLVTVIRTETGEGVHTGLMINASERIMWDPAGTWWNPRAPERNDVHHGLTPGMVGNYINYHTREAYHTITHEIDVTPDVAQEAYRSAVNYGAVPKAQCSLSTSRILSDLPGFKSVGSSFFPRTIMNRFAKLPGVRERTYLEDIPASGS